MNEEEKSIYDVFDEFLKNSLINTDNENFEKFKKENLEILLNRYVKNYIGDTKDEKGNALLKKLKEKASDAKKREKISLTFENKVNEQFRKGNIFNSTDDVSANAKLVFGYLMWLQYLPATKPGSNESYGKEKCKQIERITELEVEYKYDGCAGYGMAAMRLDEDLTDLVLLFYELVQNKWKIDNSNKQDLEQIKNYIIKWCLDLTEKSEIPNDKEKGIRSAAYNTNAQERKCPEELLPIHNMLLHLCYPKKYAPIAVYGHKKKIVETFEGLIPLKNKELDLSKANGIFDDENGYNKKLHIILDKLGKNVRDLYGKDYKDLWNVGSDKEYSDVNALKFKKAIILYGPPGTSKTYSSEGLAKNLIFQLEYKKDVSGFLENDKNNQFEHQIHHLQLHPNYTYEDFIWGYQIENKEFYKKDGNGNENKNEIVCVGNQTVAKKGYFLRLLDKISTPKTHILILDEINRVDLSRLFGELFSAIENRNKLVDLPVEVEGNSQISIPDNLYIIGTMNEIDFSLERVDFALRRRFAWFFYGYSEDRLKDILEYKLKFKPVSKFDDYIQQKYVKCCSALNKMIDEDADLGHKYEIGHTFFAELVDIWKDMPRKDIKFIQEIIWNISIGPMIEAYLGNCDEKTKNGKMGPFKTAFIIDKDND